MEIPRKRWFAALIPMLILSLAIVGSPAFSGDDDEPEGDDECPDAWITTKVGTKLTFSGMVKIDVSTEECVVTLRGCVKSEEKRNKALSDAKNTKYVKQVVNKIEICAEDDD